MVRGWLVILSFAVTACGGADSGAAPAAGETAVVQAVDPSADEQPVDLAADPRFRELYRTAAGDSGSAQAKRALAIALHENRYYEAAVEHFEAAVEIEPSSRALLDLALGYTSAARLRDAERTYRRLLELEPANATALHNLGNLSYKWGDLEASIEYYRKSLVARPDYMLAQLHLAETLRHAGQFEESYRAYEGVLELEPRSSLDVQAYDDALYQLASLDIQMGAHERAGRLLVELLEANPEHPSANYALGQVLLTMGRTEEAARAFATHQRIRAAMKPDGPAAMGD